MIEELLRDADRDSQLHFWEVLAHNLTVSVRAVWSDPLLQDADKLDQIRWINEFQHHVTAKVYIFRLQEHEWPANDFDREVDELAIRCPLFGRISSQLSISPQSRLSASRPAAQPTEMSARSNLEVRKARSPSPRRELVTMRLVCLVALSLLFGRCRTFNHQGTCEGDALDRAVLVRQVLPEQIRVEYLSEVSAESLPAQPRLAVEQWIDSQVNELLRKRQPGDQIWFYKYEKCCGWYRAGYYLVRGSCIIAEINTREDM